MWEKQPSKLSKIKISAYVHNIQEGSRPLPSYSATSTLQSSLVIGATFASQNLFSIGIIFKAKKYSSARQNTGFAPAKGKIILSIKETDYFSNSAMNVPQPAMNGLSQQNTSLFSELIITGNNYVPSWNRAESCRIFVLEKNQESQCNIYSKFDSISSFSFVGKSAGSHWSLIITLKYQCRWVTD